MVCFRGWVSLFVRGLLFWLLRLQELFLKSWELFINQGYDDMVCSDRGHSKGSTSKQAVRSSSTPSQKQWIVSWSHIITCNMTTI